MSKEKVLSRLLNKERPKDIAASCDTKLGTILRWQRELDEAILNNEVSKLMSLSSVAIDAVIAVARDDQPDEIVEALSELKVTLSQAELLQQEFNTAALTLATRVNAMSATTVSIGELSMLADTLCVLQTAFFNSNKTQVNVQNNYDSSNRGYSSFLSDAPNATN